MREEPAPVDVRFAWRGEATDDELAKKAGCEWMEVDFDDHLASFYYGACGFVPTPAGLLHLPDLQFAERR